MARNPFMHTAVNDSVATPPALLADIMHHFAVDFDPAPLHPSFDGLQVGWGTSNFVNPPFSDIGPWVQRALACPGQTVMLLPYRATSSYWRKYVWPHMDAMYCFIDGIQFVGYDRAFATPMVLVVFHAARTPPALTTLGGYSVVQMAKVHKQS